MNIATSKHRDVMFNVKRILYAWYSNCFYCGEILTRETRSIEHIMNRAQGGSSISYFNLVVCCRRCNNWKSKKKATKDGINSLIAKLLHNKIISKERATLLKATLNLRLSFYEKYKSFSIHEAYNLTIPETWRREKWN